MYLEYTDRKSFFLFVYAFFLIVKIFVLSYIFAKYLFKKSINRYKYLAIILPIKKKTNLN